jgi:hypothetical protein
MLHLALGLALLSGAPALAERRPFSIDQMSRSQTNAENVGYFGGPVISHVKVNLVYWGTGVATQTQASLEAFYRGIVDSTYMDQMAEYATNINAVDGRRGTDQTIGRGSFGGTFTISPVNKSSRLTQADLEAELETQIRSGGLPKSDGDSLYMIHFPDGYRISISYGESCSSWFADHEVYRSNAFGNVAYAVFPCDSGDSTNFGTLTFAASHELAEAVTDPMSPLQGAPVAFPAGWLRPDDQEIGDLCTGSRGTFTSGGVGYSVNPVWLNSQGACAPGDFSRRPAAVALPDVSRLDALNELKTLSRISGLPRP